MLHEFIDWILVTVNGWGYAGLFILMALESTVLPIPSELVLISGCIASSLPAVMTVRW